MSYKVAVKVTGEPQWNYNAQRFATEEEAQAAGEDLYSRWTLVERFEVQESADPVNYKWEDGKAVALFTPSLTNSGRKKAAKPKKPSRASKSKSKPSGLGGIR